MYTHTYINDSASTVQSGGTDAPRTHPLANSHARTLSHNPHAHTRWHGKSRHKALPTQKQARRWCVNCWGMTPKTALAPTSRSPYGTACHLPKDLDCLV